MASQRSKLIVASSEENADLYWATRFFVPDPVYFIHKGRHKYLLLSDLEYGRALKEAKGCKVIPVSHYQSRLNKRRSPEARSLDILMYFLRDHKIRSVEVPANFPFKIALALKKRGLSIQPANDMLYPARLIKTAYEKREIRKSLQAVSQAYGIAMKILRRSRIRKNLIYFAGQKLTSEVLRGHIDQHLLSQGYLAQHTIVACGRQSADPHCTGSGPLKPHRPIIIDIFPHSQKTGYFGDMTRTVVKGKADPRLKKMYQAVQEAQQAAIKKIRAGVKASQVHKAVCEVFDQTGFKTGKKNGIPQGFIHSTGHGLGLEIHEPPRLAPNEERLKKDHIITVEPGLYYPAIGGVRLEDVVAVTRRGSTLLSHFPQKLEVP
jgi:Xaa-Pro aminopeptidase